MDIITLSQLSEMLPRGRSRAPRFIAPLNNAMHVYHINAPLRIAAFIAQIGHESGSLLYVKELASGNAYEGRQDLGNIFPGDGVKYKGRGLLQITGRSNYLKCGNALRIDLISHPELLEQPIYAALSAAWYWDRHGLNELADRRAFKQITKVINGGYNGLAEREFMYNNCKKILGI